MNDRPAGEEGGLPIGNGRELSHSGGKEPERCIWIGLEVGLGRRRGAAEHQPKEVGSGARKADIHDAESDDRPSRVCWVVDGAKLIEQFTETKSRDGFEEGRLVREMPVRRHSGDASLDRQLAEGDRFQSALFEGFQRQRHERVP